MSVQIASDKHISFVLNASSPMSPSEKQALGQAILDLNYSSYNARYLEQNQPRVFALNENVGYLVIIEARLKALNFLRYHCIEAPDYEHNDSRLWLEREIETCTSLVLREIPKYVNAPWGIV